MKTICGSCGKPVIGNGWFHSRLRVVVHPSLDCMRNLKGEDVTGHTMQLISAEPETTDRKARGRFAYETWMTTKNQIHDDDTAFDPFECLPLSWQECWCRVGEVLSTGNKAPNTADRQTLGKFAYNTYETGIAASGKEVVHVSPAWESLYPDQQEAWCQVGEAFSANNHKTPSSADNEARGKLAYETWMSVTQGSEVADAIYPAWECLHPAQQEAWRAIGALLWQAGFEAGSDFMSVVFTNIWSPLPENTEF